MVHGLPVPEGSVGLQHDALGSEVVDGVLAVEEGVDFDLIHGGPRRYPGVEELLVIFHGVVRQPDVTYLPLPLQFLQSFVSLDVLSRHRPVYQVEIDVVRAEIGERCQDGCFFYTAIGTAPTRENDIRRREQSRNT